MSSLKEDWVYHKESQQKRYGHYCNKVRSKSEEPLPYHKWQETDNILEKAKFSKQDLEDLYG